MDDAPANMGKPLELQMLTLSDPAARANMLRHVGAVRKLLLGHVEESADDVLLIGTGFGVTDSAEHGYRRLVEADGVDRLYLMFDVDDALGPPHGFGLFHREDGRTLFYHYASPWLPSGGGRPLISASNGVENGFFSCRPDGIRRVRTPPEHEFKPGYRRADHRIGRLLKTTEIRNYSPKPVFFRFVE